MPFIDSSDINWNVFLKNENHDLYHLPEYVELDASLHGGRAVAWVCDYGDCKCLMPLVSRSVNSRPAHGTLHLRDLCSPYGYPGLLTSAPLTPGDALDLLHQFHREAAEAGFVSSFIRLNPFLNNWQLPGSRVMKQIYYGETVSINLSAKLSTNQSENLSAKLSTNQSENLSAKLSTNQSASENSLITFNLNHRRNIKRLHQNGLQVVVNDFSLMPQFIEAYYQTMHRRNASKYYFFPENYFSKLKELTSNHLVFISVLMPNGEYISGGLFTVYGSIMQYHLGATIDSAVHLSPSKLVIETAIKSGIAGGASILHLGGGLGGSKTDGVFRFKAGFSNDRHTYSGLQFIHDPEAYHRLNMMAGIGNEQSWAFSEKLVAYIGQNGPIKKQSFSQAVQTTYSNPDYFPQYRAAHG